MILGQGKPLARGVFKICMFLSHGRNRKKIARHQSIKSTEGEQRVHQRLVAAVPDYLGLREQTAV